MTAHSHDVPLSSDCSVDQQGRYGPFLNPVPTELDHELITEKRNGLEIDFDFDRAAMHIIRFVARSPLSTTYLEDVLEDARKRTDDPKQIEELVSLFDQFIETPEGEEVLGIIEAMTENGMITGDNPTLLRRLTIVAGSIVLIEHGLPPNP